MVLAKDMLMQAQDDWQETNRAYLMAEVELVRQAIKQAILNVNDQDRERESNQGGQSTPAPTETALDTLCNLCHLSAFERSLLLLCVGCELDSTFPALCASAQGDAQRNYPTFSLALAALPGSYWAAFSSDAPLRRWRLIEVEAGPTLMLSPLRIDERILHYLLGISCLDKRMASVAQPVRGGEQLVPSHEQVARQIAATWARMAAGGEDELPVIQLCGTELVSQRAITLAACELVNHRVLSMSAQALPVNPAELETLLLLWEREAALGRYALLLDCQGLEKMDTSRDYAIERLIESNRGLLVLATRERLKSHSCMLLTFDVQKPTAGEQYQLWQAVLGEQAAALNGQVQKLVSHFQFNQASIAAVYAGTQGRLAASPGEQAAERIGEVMWDVSRMQSRPKLDDLAQRIEPAASWDDLVLPEEPRQVLRAIAVQVRQRTQVYDVWGFRSKGTRGLGISALFVGASGVGKTMAAEVLANELHLDLYRIDLSAVVSKYIGETEKNLRHIFDAAEESSVILLFDEADALFGKRTEVKDSHDRYANIEVSYLLQRMESYRGLAILTTNMKDTLDTAFLRRIRFVARFPFPDAAMRAEIWRHIFPATTPTEGLSMERLAQLNLSGGNIRSIALNAAFIAADAGEAVRMRHILRAARTEYSKLEKIITGAELRGWNETE